MAVVSTLCAAMCAVGLSAQNSPPGGFSLVVDFMALDSRGHPITDLRADEIVVRVGRETANIRGLRLLPAAAAIGGPVERSRTLAFGSVEAANFERSFLVVVDDESLPQGSEQSTREAIRSFLTRLDARDRVGLVVVPHGDVRILPTTDHGRVIQSVQRISGRAMGRESAADAACRTRNVLRELDTLLMAAEGPTGPLTLVLFSGSMYDGGGAIQAPLGTSMACDVQLSDFRQLGLRASRSRGYIYIVQPETFGGLPWTSSPRSGLEQLAGVTGGRILQLSGRDHDVLNQLTLETSAVYVAQITLEDQPRSVQTLGVKTSRPTVTIVARPHVTMPGDGVPR